jgi:hypothetical protein
MSIRVQRALRNLIHGPYGRWIMLGLLIVILFVFTVTQEVEDWLRGLFGGKAAASMQDVAGSFALLPGAVTQVDHASFQAASRRYGLARSFLFRASADRNPPEIDVWTHLLLLEAAKKEGIEVSAEDLREVISQVVPDYIHKDQAEYRKWVQANLGTTAPALESAVLEFLTALRVREVYRDSFIVAPAAPRQAALEQAANQNIEYAHGDYAVLDAARFLVEAEDELKSEADPDARLREFFDKDPTLTLDPEKFRHPRRFRIELFYTIHGNVDSEEKLERIKTVVTKAYPDAKFPEINVAERKTYYGTYRDRLLEMAGETLATVTDKVQQQEPKKEEPGKPEEPAGTPGETEKPDEPGAKPEEGEKKPDEAPKPEEPKPEEPKAEEPKPEAPKPEEPKPTEPSDELREKINRFGYEIVKEQVAREVAVRTIYDFLLDQTRDNVSFKEMFEKLRANDDPGNPVCGTEPGKGLLMYRDFDGKALSGDELQEIEDSGVKFGFSFRPRVTGLSDADLPKKSRKADTLGDAGHGRQIFRLLEVIKEQRKTFDELTPGEKEDLRRLYYLPERARARAREKLEGLRQRLVDGAVAADAFRSEAQALGCRVYEGEWFEASYDSVREPNGKVLWPDELLHMRDRHFLRKSIAQALDRDRAKPEGKEELKPPCFLPVDVDIRRDEGEPGSAYLFRLRERKKPDATTITAAEMSRYLRTFANQRMHEEQERWMGDPKKIITAFDMTFDDEMRQRIDEDLERREDARRGGKPR